MTWNNLLQNEGLCLSGRKMLPDQLYNFGSMQKNLTCILTPRIYQQVIIQYDGGGFNKRLRLIVIFKASQYVWRITALLSGYVLID
jgi:hypothetical protein